MLGDQDHGLKGDKTPFNLVFPCALLLQVRKRHEEPRKAPCESTWVCSWEQASANEACVDKLELSHCASALPKTTGPKAAAIAVA